MTDPDAEVKKIIDTCYDPHLEGFDEEALRAFIRDALLRARSEALEEAAGVVDGLLNVDDTAEYQQGIIDAHKAIRALKEGT